MPRVGRRVSLNGKIPWNIFNLIGLTRLRGGALSPIRNQRLLFEATSSVKIRVFSLALRGCIPTAEKVDLKFIQCGFESHHPYHAY